LWGAAIRGQPAPAEVPRDARDGLSSEARRSRAVSREPGGPR
jgi:hypothetical protein